MTTHHHDFAAQARGAIEIVCSGDLSRMEEFYSPDFVDHVNDTTLQGYEGGRESVGFYRAIFKDLRMGVDDQVTEGHRVASRWFLMGNYHGRPVTLRGITISRFGEDGRILEDHAHSDTISLARQIGIARTLVLAVEVLTRRAKLPKGSLQRS
jgi:predicted ester cyclase